MTSAERRDEAAVILEGVLESVRMAHNHSDVGRELGSVLALLERNLEHLDDLVVHIEVPSDVGAVVERATNHPDVGEQMTELEEALRIAHGTAVMLSSDPDLDSAVTGTIEGISAQLRRAKGALEAIAQRRADDLRQGITK
jgi:hypothetical protein